MLRPRRSVCVVLALVALGCTRAAADPALPRVNALVVKECSRILDQIRDTQYRHTTHVVVEKGVYHVDCSGFLCHFLDRFAPEALAAVPVEPKCDRQRAVTFHTSFSAAPTEPKGHWQKIARLEDALPGDFWSWRKVVIPRKGNTGHCGVVWEKPVRQPDGLIRVRILDSTTSPHLDDPRKPPKITGLVVGTMLFVVNDKGEPIGYYWAKKSGSPTLCPIAVARLRTFGRTQGPGDRIQASEGSKQEPADTCQ